MIKLTSTANQYQKEYQALSSDLPLADGVASDTKNIWRFTYPTEEGTRTDIIGNGAGCFIVDTSAVYVFHDGSWYKI